VLNNLNPKRALRLKQTADAMVDSGHDKMYVWAVRQVAPKINRLMLRYCQDMLKLSEVVTRNLLTV
jgi:hypothetical protein